MSVVQHSNLVNEFTVALFILDCNGELNKDKIQEGMQALKLRIDTCQ